MVPTLPVSQDRDKSLGIGARLQIRIRMGEQETTNQLKFRLFLQKKSILSQGIRHHSFTGYESEVRFHG
jgi:hypothetical protein